MGHLLRKKDLYSVQRPTTCKRLACPHTTPSPVPVLLPPLIAVPSIPPHLVPRTSPWAFVFPLSCSRGKLDTFLHPLLPHPSGLGPKASPQGSAPTPATPLTSSNFQGTDVENIGQAGVVREASGPSPGQFAV